MLVRSLKITIPGTICDPRPRTIGEHSDFLYHEDRTSTTGGAKREHVEQRITRTNRATAHTAAGDRRRAATGLRQSDSRWSASRSRSSIKIGYIAETWSIGNFDRDVRITLPGSIATRSNITTFAHLSVQFANRS